MESSSEMPWTYRTLWKTRRRGLTVTAVAAAIVLGLDIYAGSKPVVTGGHLLIFAMVASVPWVIATVRRIDASSKVPAADGGSDGGERPRA
jgi:hypothetical protein